MPRCAAFKPDNSPCERIVAPSHTYCYAHDPSRSEQRRRAASKAAKSKPNPELAHIKQTLKDLAQDLLEGRVGRADAAVVSQLYNVLLRTLEVERKIREQDELAERLDELEKSKHLWEEALGR